MRGWKEKKKIGRRKGERKEGQEDWIGKKGRRKNGNIEEVEKEKGKGKEGSGKGNGEGGRRTGKSTGEV